MAQFDAPASRHNPDCRRRRRETRVGRGAVVFGVLLALAATSCGTRFKSTAVDGLGRTPTLIHAPNSHRDRTGGLRVEAGTTNPLLTRRLVKHRAPARQLPPQGGAVASAEPAAAAQPNVARSHRHFAPRADVRRVPKTTLLATLQHRTRGYATAHSVHPSMRVPRGWYGRTSVLPVLRRRGSRLKVRLARRPDESKIWISRRAVTLSRTHYAIVVDLSVRRLYLFRGGVQKGSYAVGVGAPGTPTPTGTYFVAFHAPPNSPEYGPVMLETSAHSRVFRTFEGGNDAIIAIHGPIGSDAEIGNHGAAISNGCIRMHDGSLVKVARVPDGAPVILAP